MGAAQPFGIVDPVTEQALAAKVAVARAHAAAESQGDIGATMATLVDDPVYELQPVGVVLRGRDAVRRYYEHFFASFAPRVAGSDLRSEWVNDEGLGQEYVLFLRDPVAGTTRHSIIGILTFGAGTLLSGERLYASDELIGMLFGALFDEATPV